MGGSVTAGDLIPKKCKYYYAPTLIQSWLALLYPAAPSSRQRGLASGKARRRRHGITGDARNAGQRLPPQCYSLLFPLPLSILFSSSLISAPLSSFYRCSQVQAEQSGFGILCVICHVLKSTGQSPTSWTSLSHRRYE